MSAIARLFNPYLTSNFALAASGRELFGTVVKAGVNRKTVTVKVDRFYREWKLQKIFSNPRTFQVHDEEQYCVVGDKVVIRLCRPISKTKCYYVRNVVLAVPRDLPENVVGGKKEEPRKQIETK